MNQRGRSQLQSKLELEDCIFGGLCVGAGLVLGIILLGNARRLDRILRQHDELRMSFKTKG